MYYEHVNIILVLIGQRS